MIQEKYSLNELQLSKARDYFNMYRDRQGVPEKLFVDCLLEAQEDFGEAELSTYNQRNARHWNRIMDAPRRVIWADGTADDKRECAVCGKLCSYPVHQDSYREVGVTRITKEEVENV